MTRRPFTVLSLMGLLLLGVVISTSAQSFAEKPSQDKASQGKGMAAIKQAAKADKYLFIYFWKADDQQSKAMFPVFQEVMGKMSDRADGVPINLAVTTEKPIIEMFDVSRAPMPIVVAVAPNGAVTRGFPRKFDEKQLQQAFVSPCTEQCLLALQQRKLVLLCVQNEKTQFSQAALKGAQDFRADERFAKATEIITINPNDRAEKSFLDDLRISPSTPTAVTVLLAPPGSALATFTGALTKDEIVAKVAAAQSGPCADGQCGPGGCCPPQK
jgi:hypothetical protein